jgi:hypothetical protein
VHLSLGHLDTAEAIAEDIARRAPPDSPGWFRACFIRARVAVKRGQPEKARPILEDALKRAKAISDEDLFAANALLTKISEPSP